VVFIIEHNSTNEPSVLWAYFERKKEKGEASNYKFMCDPKTNLLGLTTFNHVKVNMTHELRLALDDDLLMIDDQFFTTERMNWTAASVLQAMQNQLQNWARTPLTAPKDGRVPEFTYSGKMAGADDIAMAMGLLRYWVNRVYMINMSTPAI
jgi:hypothetical protein